MSMPPTQPIAEWLAKIDLERCAAAFAVNDIDVSVLGHLTDTDSEKMRASRSGIGERCWQRSCFANLESPLSKVHRAKYEWCR